jgi:hypothetical protein
LEFHLGVMQRILAMQRADSSATAMDMDMSVTAKLSQTEITISIEFG